MSNIYFDSRRNYLKQAESGSGSANRPATLDATFSEYYTEFTVTHNLGYRPLVRAWYDPDNNGTIFPSNGQKFIASSDLYFNGDVDFMFYAVDITDTAVTFRAARESALGALTGTFTYYYKIYIDPSVGAQP